MPIEEILARQLGPTNRSVDAKEWYNFQEINDNCRKDVVKRWDAEPKLPIPEPVKEPYPRCSRYLYWL